MTPKQRYLLRPEADLHLKIAHTEHFAVTMDFALLEFVEHLPRVEDAALAMANHHRLEGAKMLRRQIETIADKPAPAKPLKPQFDHRTP